MNNTEIYDKLIEMGAKTYARDGVLYFPSYWDSVQIVARERGSDVFVRFEGKATTATPSMTEAQSLVNMHRPLYALKNRTVGSPVELSADVYAEVMDTFRVIMSVPATCTCGSLGIHTETCLITNRSRVAGIYDILSSINHKQEK